MKKPIALLLALAMVLSLAACSGKDGEEDADGGEKEEKSWRDLMEEGEALLDDEEFDDAVDVLSDAIDQKDNRAELYTLRGQAYLGKGGKSALKKAVKDFEAALELDEESEDAWVGLVETLMAQEEYEDAAEKAREGLDVLGSSRALDRLLDDIGEELGSTPGDTEEPGDTAPPPPPETEPPETEPVHVHSWMDANYQRPRWCIECGETEGEPLTPDFEFYNIVCDLQVGVTTDYTTNCYEDHDVLTTGSLTVLSYNIIDSDDARSHVDGYEWRVAQFEARFYDQNAYNYGYSPKTCVEDYYSITLHDDSAQHADEGNYYSALYYGDIVDVFVRTEVLMNEWGIDDVATVIWEVSALVPIGYDGIVWGLHSSDEDYSAGYIYNSYTPSNWRLFRFA